MKEYERKQLLERIDREGSTVGSRIPECIKVGGDPLDLREFVFEIKRLDTVPPTEREQVDRAKKALRRERLARRQAIESDDITREAGERLVDSILGIERALNALRTLEPRPLEAEAEDQTAADRKRWMSFLKQVLGRDDGRRSRP